MDERNTLNDDKTEFVDAACDALQDVALRIMRWQMHTRGLTPYAAYKEAKGEVERMLDALQEDVNATLREAVLESRLDGRTSEAAR